MRTILKEYLKSFIIEAKEPMPGIPSGLYKNDELDKFIREPTYMLQVCAILALALQIQIVVFKQAGVHPSSFHCKSFEDKNSSQLQISLFISTDYNISILYPNKSKLASESKIQKCLICGENITTSDSFNLSCKHGYHKSCLRQKVLDMAESSLFREMVCKFHGCDQKIYMKDLISQGVVQPAEIEVIVCDWCHGKIREKSDLTTIKACTHNYHKECVNQIDSTTPCIDCKMYHMEALKASSYTRNEPEILCKLCGMAIKEIKQIFKINCCYNNFCMNCMRKKFADKNFMDCNCPVCKAFMIETDHNKILLAHICDKCKCEPTPTLKLVQLSCGHWLHCPKCSEVSLKYSNCELCKKLLTTSDLINLKPHTTTDPLPKPVVGNPQFNLRLRK